MDDDELYKFDDFGFIGFDLWQALYRHPNDSPWARLAGILDTN